MSNSTSDIQQLANGQQNPDIVVNNVNNSQSPASLWGNNALTSSGLVWGYFGGIYNSQAISNGSVTLTASATNYIVANATTGVVSASTSIASWNNTTSFIRLYIVSTSATAAYEWFDYRQCYSVTRSQIPAITTVSLSNHTLTLSNAGSYIRMTSASANTVTIPTNSAVAFAIGESITVRRAGAGSTTIVPSSGVTLNTTGTSFQLRKQHSTVQLLKVGTDEWDLLGDVSEA